MKSFSAYRGATAAALPSLRVPGLSVQALCLLALAMQAQATQIVVTIDPGVRTSNTEGQCLFPTPGFTGHDCSYNASNPAGAVLATKWVGPVYSAAFFGPGAAPQATPDNFINPTGPGDGRIGIPLSGTITIDDQGNPAACSAVVCPRQPHERETVRRQVGAPKITEPDFRDSPLPQPVA